MTKHPVSEWMKAERGKRGWKQTDVAPRLRAAGHEAEDGTYRVWEAGRPPRRSTIEALERLFETPAPGEDTASSDLSALVAALDRQTAALTALVERMDREREDGPAWASEAVDTILGALRLAPTHPASDALAASDVPLAGTESK